MHIQVGSGADLCVAEQVLGSFQISGHLQNGLGHQVAEHMRMHPGTDLAAGISQDDSSDE